jgi:hypothetical protein
MANEELIALLQNLQGSGAGRVLNPGLLAQLPALAEPEAGSRDSTVASNAASSALRGVSGLGGLGPLGELGGGLTLLPVVGSLLKLFGVGRSEELPALEKFALPAPIRAEAGLSRSGDTFLIDRGVGDRIRPLPAPASTTSVTGTQSISKQSTASSSITVNVQAMDSQSFMDRREDIARAVREAMLQSHSLNDVVSEL